MALTDGLTNYWKLDESSGNASDSVGSTTLTNVGTVTYAAALINNGAYLNTSSKQLENTSNLTATTGDFSVQMWVKCDAEISSGFYGFGEFGNNTTDVRYWFLYNYNGGTRQLIFTRDRVGSTQTDVTYTVALGTGWNQLVGTFSGSTVTLYTNGTSRNTGSSSGDGTSNNANPGVFLGEIPRFGGLTANGYVDEVGIWNRAITADEVSQLYNSGAGLEYPFSTQTYTSPSGGVAYSGGLTMY